MFVATEFRSNPPGLRLQSGLNTLGLTTQFAACRDERANGVLIASRTESEAVLLEPAEIDRGRITACRIGARTIAGVYFPGMDAKATLFDYLLSRPVPLTERALVIGDFNTGLHRIDELGATFRCADHFSRLGSGPYVDLWRSRHGPDERQYTWYSRTGGGFRIDHAFATPCLASDLVDCRYDHSTRQGLTDHSAIMVEFGPAFRV